MVPPSGHVQLLQPSPQQRKIALSDSPPGDCHVGASSKVTSVVAGLAVAVAAEEVPKAPTMVVPDKQQRPRRTVGNTGSWSVGGGGRRWTLPQTATPVTVILCVVEELAFSRSCVNPAIIPAPVTDSSASCGTTT